MVSIGRSTERYYPHTIPLRPHWISRLHMLINRNGLAINMRSLNGTTINAEFLPYGESKTLEDGDLIALAGVAPFRFNRIQYASLDVLPYEANNIEVRKAWGVLIDGAARRIHYLDAQNYYVGLDNAHNVTISKQKGATTLMSMNFPGDGYIRVQDEADGNQLRIQMKAGDYTYLSCEVPAGVAFTVFDPSQLKCVTLAQPKDHIEVPRIEQNFKVSYQYGNTHFQIMSSFLLDAD